MLIVYHVLSKTTGRPLHCGTCIYVPELQVVRTLRQHQLLLFLSFPTFETQVVLSPCEDSSRSKCQARNMTILCVVGSPAFITGTILKSAWVAANTCLSFLKRPSNANVSSIVSAWSTITPKTYHVVPGKRPMSTSDNDFCLTFRTVERVITCTCVSCQCSRKIVSEDGI